jgi:hypothetical protein
MSKNITINGENYNGVSTIKALVQGSATEYAEFIDADEVETGGDAVLTTKTITVNGTYAASADNADGFSAVTVNVPTGGGGGEVADFPFPYNNIQTGSFTPTENEEEHSITLPFHPKGFLCILDDISNQPGTYAGVAWFYLEGADGGFFSTQRYAAANGALTGGSNNNTIEGNTVTLSANVVQPNHYFYAGRTYNWVAWN